MVIQASVEVGLTNRGAMGNAPKHRQAPPLWQQLQAVAIVLVSVRAGKSWSTAQNDVDPTLRAGIQALSFTVLRNLGCAQVVRDLLVKRSPPAAADALLCVALGLTLTNSGASSGSVDVSASPAYDAHTLVNQAVEAAKRNPATYPQAGFLNGCLRRYLREKDALLIQAQQKPQARWNHPAWWVARLQKDHPTQWQMVLHANATQAPLTLRINATKTSQEAYLSALSAMNLEAIPVVKNGLQLAHSTYVPDLPGYLDGWFSVQDAAAQVAAPLLLQNFADRAKTQSLSPSSPSAKPAGVLRVLDACAAPGGKTAHLLEFASTHNLAAQITALDIDAVRCERIHENLQRLGLQANVVVADAANPDGWWDGVQFDAVLLDAPCTASGIVRRYPDVRWLRRESDIAQLAAQQKRLLGAMWPLLVSGGQMLYCTCSVFLSEGQSQVQAFLAHNKDAVLLPSPGHLLPQKGAEQGGMLDNDLGGHDGFYYALLQKK